MKLKKNVQKQDFEDYLNEARTWETDKVQALEKSKKTAWRVATGAGVLALASVLAVAGMTPLKQTVPYVIRVDNTTGIVDVVNALKDGKENYEEALNKYFVQWYVRYRESYASALAQDYYYDVGIMSSGPEQQRYYQYFNPKNPLSPLNVYGQYATVRVNILSTSFINPNVALVRYTKAVTRGSDQPQVTHWAATITFKYTKAPAKESDRAINPLGIQVTEYRNDPDSMADSGTPQAPVAAVQPAADVSALPTVPTPASPTQTAPAVPALAQ